MDSPSRAYLQAANNAESNTLIAGNRLPFDAILWDIDGTLLDSEPIHELAFEDTCKELGLEHGEIKNKNHFLGTTEEVTHQWLVDEFKLSVSFEEWSLLRFKHYLSHIEKVQPHSESLEIWKTLNSFKFTQAVVSNADRMVVQANLDRLGLNLPGMVSIARNDVRKGKPDPEPYLRAAHLLGLSPNKCAAVEDSSPGALSAFTAGMKVYSMPWLTGEMKVKTEDLAELKDLVELIRD